MNQLKAAHVQNRCVYSMQALGVLWMSVAWYETTDDWYLWSQLSANYHQQRFRVDHINALIIEIRLNYLRIPYPVIPSKLIGKLCANVTTSHKYAHDKWILTTLNSSLNHFHLKLDWYKGPPDSIQVKSICCHLRILSVAYWQILPTCS